MIQNLIVDDFAVYGAWQHPELAKLGWSTVLNKGEVYNNCQSKDVGLEA